VTTGFKPEFDLKRQSPLGWGEVDYSVVNEAWLKGQTGRGFPGLDDTDVGPGLRRLCERICDSWLIFRHGSYIVGHMKYRICRQYLQQARF
jgi:hypothetical protein